MGDATEQESLQDRPEFTYAEYTTGIREIHHRVKNNLQVIVSLFGLQADRTTEPQVINMLGEMQNRLRAIAYLHEPLYSSADFSTILFNEYLRAFLRELESFYNLGVRVEAQLSLADLALNVEQALPLALIGNELISNALKHAFPGDRSGKISIALQYGPDGHGSDGKQSCELQVADDGVGLPPGIDLATAESMGLYLVRILTQQLQGTVETRRDGGTTISVRFPLIAE